MSVIFSRFAQQSSFRETLGNSFSVLLPKGLPAEMFSERVFRIDLFEFALDATGLIDLAEMTQGRCEYGAAKIRFGNEENPLP